MSYKKILKTLKEKSDLFKAPVKLDESASNSIGSNFVGAPSPKYVKGHVGSYEMKNGMFHHIIESKMGGLSHYLSTNKDPWDEKSQVAKIQGSPRMGSFTITHSSVRPEDKGKGYGKHLYASVLAHHGNIQSDSALTQRSHNAWQHLKNNTQGMASVQLANLGEKGTRHKAIGDKTKLQQALHKRRIAPKSSKLAASEQDVLFKVEDLKTPSNQVKLNPEHGKTIADAYHNMKHDPNHPEVQKAYGALINETKKQFQDMMGSGLKISRIQPGQENPYKNSKELHADIKNNNHLHFFPTEQGFGSDGSDKSDHPMMQGTGIMHEGKELLANDLFRIVHDYYGHHKGGESGFGPKGEHRAYLTHKKMFSPLAQKALATETLGQNSWVNFGPHGDHNRANPHETKYAEQKAGLLPDHIISGNWHTEDNSFKKKDSIDSINWVKPDKETILKEFQHEEGVHPEFHEELMDIVKDAKVINVDHNKITEDEGRGGGADPKKEWILDPNSVPKDVLEDRNFDKYRYYHDHHKPGGIIHRIKNGDELHMPIVIGDELAVSGRHRIAYSKVLGLPTKALSVDPKRYMKLYSKMHE